MQRWGDTEDDVLTADGYDLDRLLAEWEPVSGLYLSDQWLSELETAPRPRETFYGADKGAHQQFPHWSAARATLPADRRD